MGKRAGGAEEGDRGEMRWNEDGGSSDGLKDEGQRREARER